MDGGRKNLVYVFDLENDSAQAKRRGFVEGLKLRDVPQPESRVFTAAYGLEGGMRAAKEIIRSGIPFDGVVCGEDTTAIGVMTGLKKQGYRVPEDVAVSYTHLGEARSGPDGRLPAAYRS